LFTADSIDGLTVEQYNILVELLNMQAKEAEKDKKTGKNTISIVSVDESDVGITDGDD